MGLPISGASSSKGSILGFDYEPVDLAPPILPQPKLETFIDAKVRLRHMVSDKVIPLRPFSQAYSYSPLKENEIRLLKLEPGKLDDEIRCRMIYAPPNQPEVFRRYNALSYHWGFDQPTNYIQIIDDRLQNSLDFSTAVMKVKSNSSTKPDSASKERWFSVRGNLFSALRGLRHRHRPLLLWVDAICINQTPEDEDARKEKHQQVNNMAQIYSAAKSVSIWLGEGTAETDKTMRFLRKVVTDIPNLDSYFSDAQNWQDWLALRNLLTFKWFSRRWIVQDVALARDATVHCGKQSINWIDFADGVALFVDRMGQDLTTASGHEQGEHDLFTTVQANHSEYTRQLETLATARAFGASADRSLGSICSELQRDENHCENIENIIRTLHNKIPSGLERTLDSNRKKLKRTCAINRRKTHADVVGNMGEALGRMFRCANAIESTILRQQVQLREQCRNLREEEMQRKQEADVRIEALSNLMASPARFVAG